MSLSWILLAQKHERYIDAANDSNDEAISISKNSAQAIQFSL